MAPQDSDIPPFPSDIPTADIPTISYHDLLSFSPPALQAMLSATQGVGFFFLSHHPIDSDFMFDLADALFRLPLPEKLQYDMGSHGRYFGYKHQGASVVDASGTPDINEFYNIPKDDLLGVTPAASRLPQPAPIEDHTPQLQQFMRDAHAVVMGILRALEQGIGVPEGELLALHRLEAQSGDQARVTHAPPVASGRIALGEHTDYGSVTVLFNRLGGLQAMDPETREWRYVRPVPGCALINLGDALVQLLGRRVFSGLHRVMGPPGEQAKCSRHSVVYFARPNGDVPLKSLMDEEDGKEALTADEWIKQRATMRLKANFKGQETIDKYRAMEHARARENDIAPQVVSEA
ncbi:Clavaminate synthase-like protein [Viridothelium virens]|uniref:Clavaminate synthase-like protein n=1 Tax=Viridothelium virens TaxID=1048519 RepID=A0A6A6HQG2_VIRVR|nr:Clavaminate synthase-like protein [Viridothelium virens]